MTRSGALAVMVKTPGFSPLKTRLGKEIGVKQAEAFYEFSVGETTHQISPLAKNAGFAVYWALAKKAGCESVLWQNYAHLFQCEGGLGDRLAGIYNQLLASHDYCLIIGGDAPQVTTEIYQAGINALKNSTYDFVIGLSEDGGFYLVGGQRPIELAVWTSLVYSSSTTGEGLLAQLEEMGSVYRLPIMFDVDTLSDLKKLEQIDARVSQFMA